MALTSNEIINLLGLVPHPTCGMVKQTFNSNIVLPKDALPLQFDSNRSAGSCMYFMVTPETQIKLHKIRSDQIYHFYFGTALEVLLLYPDGTFAVKICGHDLNAGMTPQLFIPADTFHVSRLHDVSGEFSLLATSEWISVEPQDVELGDVGVLSEEYPEAEDLILQFTRI